MYDLDGSKPDGRSPGPPTFTDRRGLMAAVATGAFVSVSGCYGGSETTAGYGNSEGYSHAPYGAPTE